MFILRQASLKMAILLHTVANWRFIMIIAVYTVASRNSGPRNSGISRYSGQILQTNCLF